MQEPVIVKSNTRGYMVHLDETMDFSELKTAVEKKFREISHCLSKKPMGLSFEKRSLSSEEEEELVKIICNSSPLQVAYLADKDPEKERLFLESMMAAERRERLKKENEEKREVKRRKPDFRQEVVEDLSLLRITIGNLRSGQLVESDNGILVLGDVNPGAKVRARGNIVVLGSLRGEAEAGIDGKDDCFIIAKDMRPIQIRIGNKIAKSPDEPEKRHESEKRAIMMAFVDEDRICLEELNRDTVNHLNLPI